MPFPFLIILVTLNFPHWILNLCVVSRYEDNLIKFICYGKLQYFSPINHVSCPFPIILVTLNFPPLDPERAWCTNAPALLLRGKAK